MEKLKKRFLTLALIVGILGCGSQESIATTNDEPPAIDHILLEVRDLNSSLRFYRDFLGLKVEKISGDFAMLKALNVGVFLWSDHWKWSPVPKGSREPQGMYPHFVFSDVQGVVKKLEKGGYKIVAQPQWHWYGTEAFVADPDGFVWALISQGAK